MSDNSLSRNDIEQSLTDGDLTYLAKNSSSLVVERTSKRMYADNSTYSNVNKNIVINLQTGVDYVDGRNSFLRMTVKPSGVTPHWGHGTVLNLIEQVTLKTRSGSVIGRIEKANLLQYYETKYKMSPDWFGTNLGDSSLGQGVGQGGGYLGFDDAGADLSALASGHVYNIPLEFIHSFFAQEVLLPSMVCKGLRLEITLAAPSVAFVVASGVATYEVENIWLSLDSYRLTDDAMRKLNDMSTQKEGLVLQYTDWEHNHFTRPSGVNAVSNEIRKTVSMANSAFAVTRIEADSVDATKDGFLAEPLTDVGVGVDEYQWRVGSIYLPQQSLSGKSAWYANAMYCKGNMASHEQPYVQFAKPVGNTEPSFTSTTSGYAVACVDLDRYWLDLSGLALNNNVTLNLTTTYGAAVPVAGDIDVFLKHTRRIVVYQNNVIILE